MILPSRATLIGYGVLSVLLLIAIGTAKWQHHAAVSARAERDALKGQLDTATDANASLVTTVGVQDKALKQWASLGVTPEEAKGQLDQINRHKVRSDELKAENDMLRARDRVLPECIALLKASLTKRCPSIAAGLVQLATGRGENSANRSTDSGSQAASSRTH